MLLFGAELLRIGKNLYITKSEPGANHVGTTRRKNINIGTASRKTPFLLKNKRFV